jgi:hypothetical protein
MVEINKFVHENSNCQTLWASTRMAFYYKVAKETKTDTIIMQLEHAKKLNLFATDPIGYFIKTVKQFFQDAKTSGFEF